MENTPSTLTLEQQFQLKRIESQVNTLSVEDARASLLDAMRLIMQKDNYLKQLMKENLGF